MFESLAKALAAAFSLWEHKEKNKYRDELIALKEARNEEINKDPATRSDAVLDHLEFKLRLLADSFSTQVGK
jgi:hypothetical protein